MPDGRCTPPGEENTCSGFARLAVMESDLAELRRQNSRTHERFGERIGELEKHNEVQDVRFNTIIDKLADMTSTMRDLKDESKEVSRQLPALSQKLEALQESHRSIDGDVDELKGKPGKTWEEIKSQAIGWGVALLLALLAAALGLSKFL